MEVLQQWGRGLRALGSWLVLEPLLPGATLFVLLLWLSRRFVLEGFGSVRQHANAPNGGKWVLHSPVRKNWWSCDCVSQAGCACLSAIARGLRRCCAPFNFAPRLN